MRVELPSPTPESPRRPAASETPSRSPEPRRRRPAPPLERFTDALLRPKVAWTLATITIALFAWSLLIRRPAGERYLAVSARAMAMMGGAGASTNVTSAELDRLRRDVDAIKASLISGRKELLPLLFTLETRAQQEGWRCERTLLPVQTFGSTFTNLELHPVLIRLHPARTIAPGSHVPLLRWLQTIHELERRAEISALNIQADAAGIHQAEVRLHFFSFNRNEETAAK